MYIDKKTDLSRIQIFSSDAFAKVLGYKKKLDERSKKYLFVAYALNGYRLWYENKQNITIDSDVIFKKSEIYCTKPVIFFDKRDDFTEEDVDDQSVNEEIMKVLKIFLKKM